MENGNPSNNEKHFRESIKNYLDDDQPKARSFFDTKGKKEFKITKLDVFWTGKDRPTGPSQSMVIVVRPKYYK